MKDIPILRELEKLVVEHGSAVVQEKHIKLMKDQIGWLEKRNEALEKENAQLSDNLAKIKLDLERHTIPDEYLEWQGVLIKRIPSGGYGDIPYCPICKLPMSSTPSFAGGILICNRRDCEYVSAVSIVAFRDHIDALRKRP